MQEPDSENKEQVFCQICRHPINLGDGHYKNCAVYTGEPQKGIASLQQQSSPQDPNRSILNLLAGIGPHQPIDPQNLEPYTDQGASVINQGLIPRQDGYEVAREVAKIYREGRALLIEELKVQTELNQQLNLELIQVRQELNKLKGG